VGKNLVDLSVKCGSMEDAHRVLKEMPSQKMISWNTMLGGYLP
jgi:pentatricopeptide repeat protein